MAAPSKTWNILNYILAALGGTLAATAIVIMVSVIFRPARISFFVTHASLDRLSGGDVLFNLTVSANASGQRRTKVKYESIFIDLVNSTKPATASDRVHAEVDATAWRKEYLPLPSLISVDASARLINNSSNVIEGFTGSQENIIRGLTVVVMAQVHFKVGVAPTRLFGIKVFCYGVHFADVQHNSSDATVNCYS